RVLAALRTALGAYNEKAVFDPQTEKQVRPRYEIELAEDRSELEARLRKGDLVGFLVVGRDVLEPAVPGKEPDPEQTVVYETNQLGGMEVRGQLEAVINEAVQAERGRRLGVSDPRRQEITQRVPLVLKTHAVFILP